MDENYNEENFDEQEKQNISRRNDTGVVGRLNQFSSGFKAGLLGTEDKTKERINKRGTNELRGVNKESGKMNPDGNNKKPGNKSGLEKKDGLGKKDNNKKQGAADKTGMKKPGLPGKLGESANQAVDAAAKLKKAKLLLLKLKIAGIVAGILLVVFIIAYLFTVIDNFFSSIVLNFFVPEQKEDDLEGLYTDSKYLRDPDTGEMYTWPELIKVLNNDDACEANFWEKIKEGLGIYDEEFDDACALMRYIKKKVETYEETYMGRDDPKTQPNKLDRALILGTIFYGYDSQATYDSYDTPPAKGDDKGDTYTSASDHYETLKNIIKDGKLVRKDVDRIIQSTIFEDIYPYFTWRVEIEKRKDSNGNEYEVKVGYCDTSTVENYFYSRDKWEMFIRWNDEWDRTNGDDEQERKRDYPFSVPGYLKINGKKQLEKKQYINNSSILTLVGTGYTYDTSMNNAWNTTTDKCNGSIPPEVLLQEVDELADSVTTAHEYFKKREFTQVVDTTIYFQKIEDVYTTQKDSFQSRNIKYTTYNYGVNVATTFVEFEYKHGFGYINFPSFKQADDDPNLPTFEYDDIVSPKKVEEIILETKDRKGEINNTLMLKDLDSTQYGENGYWDDDGNYIPGIDPDLDNDNIISNANCAKFLSANFDDITVKLTNCDGLSQDSVTFKDYIIGTVKGEIDNYSNENYALTQMIANMNFALNRFGNYKKGKTINMRNGDCDQVFSSPTKGSYMNTANIICYYKDKDPSKPVNCKNVYQGTAPSSDYWTYKNPMSNEEYEAYSRLYDIARNYLVIQNGTIFSTGYGSERSLNWEAEANAGKNFLQILKETYGDVDIIECSGSGNGDDDGDLDEDIGNIVAGDYRNWCQDDPRWNDNRMGTGKYTTIGANGCTSTSVAMAIAKSKVSTKLKNFNPATFVDWMNKNGGYIGYDDNGNETNGNLLVWYKPSELVNGSYSSKRTEFINEQGEELMTQGQAKKFIAGQLKNGLYPIVGVSRNGNCSKAQGRSGHWVLADRVQNGEIKILDPACYGGRNETLTTFNKICEVVVLGIN